MSKRLADPWRIIWRSATSHTVVAILLLAVAVSVMLTTWVPQQPAADADYARWFSQVQARFGDATPVMQGLGLFNVTRSFGFRLLLALLSGCLLLRLIEGVDQLRRNRAVVEPDEDWEEISGEDLSPLLDDLRRRRYRTVDATSFFQVDCWPWADLSLVAAHSGALILLVGLLLSHIWGWQVDGLVLQRGQRSSLSDGNHWVALGEDGIATSHSAGVVSFIEKRGPGVSVRAVDDQGEPLRLQLTAEAEPMLDLLVPLPEDRYIAVPEADLIAHLSPQSEAPYTRLDVRIYRSPPGEIIDEVLTDAGGQAELAMEGVTLELAAAPYVQVTVSRNPGRWPAGFGLVLLMGGVAANLMRPGCRFWLRERDELVEVAGPVPGWLISAAEEA